MNIGVDLDSTLAKHNFQTYRHDIVGEPIAPMVERVRRWLADGHEVEIFTARVHPCFREQALISKLAIDRWCFAVFGRTLNVTCMKDPRWDEYWDDKVVQVEPNTGRQLGPSVMDKKSDADGIGEFLER